MRRTKLVSFALAALLLTAGAACSKDEATTTSSGGVVAESKSGGSTTAKASDKSTTTKKDSSDSGDETSTTKKKTTTTDGSSDDSTDSTIGDITVPSGLPGNLDECVKAAQAWSAIAQSVGLLMSPGASQADVDKVEQQVDEVKGSIPDDLQADFDTWAKGFADYAKKMKEITDNGGFSNPANLDKLQEVNQIFEDSDWKAANDHLNEYFTTKCK